DASAGEAQAPDGPGGLGVYAEGSRLGEFEILGSALMNNFYRAWQPLLDRPVALKVFDGVNPGAREVFLRELRILGRLRHASLPHVYAFGADRGCLFYATEWREGTSLAHLWQRLQKRSRGSAGLDMRGWHETLSAVCQSPLPLNLPRM